LPRRAIHARRPGGHPPPRVIGEGGFAGRVGFGLRQPALGLGLRCGDTRLFLIEVGARVIETLQFRRRLGLGLAQRGRSAAIPACRVAADAASPVSSPTCASAAASAARAASRRTADSRQSRCSSVASTRRM